MKNKHFPKLNILSMIPNRKKEIKFYKDKLTIKYLSRSKGGSNSKPVTLNKKICLTPSVLKSIGIYYGEGNNSKKTRYSGISNTESEIIKYGIRLFQELGISKKILKARVKTYNLKISDSKLVAHWSSRTGIPKKNFIKTFRQYSKNKTKFKYGVLEIYFSSVVIRDIIDNFILKIKELSLQDKKIRREFLKGIISGEGSVILVNNKLRELKIGSCDINEQKFIRTLLKKDGIRLPNYKSKYHVGFCGMDNFQRVQKTHIFDLHPKKKKKFIFGLKNLRLLASGK